MQIEVSGNIVFILLSGVVVPFDLKLTNNVTLQGTDTSHLDLNTALAACSHPDDIAVVAAFIPRTKAQFAITATTKRELAIIAWNSSWDAYLLSAFLDAEVGFNLQSDTSGSSIAANSTLRATNIHMHGMSNDPPYSLTEIDATWICAHFKNGQNLLEDDSFRTAVHCLATYRWHTLPRVRLAILWAGIEGIFGASSEIRFRISLYIARYLHPTDPDLRQQIFDEVMKLYNVRSAAVHGSKIKGDTTLAVVKSAEILRKLLRRCAVDGSMPDARELYP